MLDKLSKKILRKSLNCPRDKYNQIILSPYDIGTDFNNINHSCEYLRDTGYILSFRPAITNNDNLEIELTHMGEHYFEFRWLKIKNFLFQSIFVPIVVSTVTTLITLLITYLMTK